MARPKLILLDEPSLGLAPLLVKEIFGIVKRINEEEKTTFLLVERSAFEQCGVFSGSFSVAAAEAVVQGEARPHRIA